MPNVHQTLLQLVDVVNTQLVHTLLDDDRDLVVYWMVDAVG